MQKIISKYALAAHLALMAVAPLILFPFCGDRMIATVLLWLSLFGATWLFMEPSRRADEMLHEARVRVIHAVGRDLLTWFFLLLVIFAAIRWINGGVGEAFDRQISTWFLKGADAPLLPGSVTGCGALPFATILATAIIVLGCRHALGKGARIAFFFTSATLAGVAGVTAVTLLAMGSESVIRAAACAVEDSSFVGLGFGVYFIFGILALNGVVTLRWKGAVPWFGFAIGGTAGAALFFSPHFTLLLILALAALALVVTIVYAARAEVASGALKCLMMFIFALLIPVLGVLTLQEQGVKARAITALQKGRPVLFEEGFLESRRTVSQVAKQLWSAHRWLGTGLGSFPVALQLSAEDKVWEKVSSVQKRSPNGWWHLLAERGLICGMVLVILAGFLLWTWIARFANALTRHLFTSSEGGFFRVTDPACWVCPLIAVVFAVDGFFSVSFLRSEVVMAVTSAFALSASSFPLIRKKERSVEETGEIGEKING